MARRRPFRLRPDRSGNFAMTIIRKTASPAKLTNVRTFGVLARTGGVSVAAHYDARRKAGKIQK